MRRLNIPHFVLAAVLLLARSQAEASYHFIRIVEVFPGTVANPDAQYVVLQAFSSGQTFVSGVGLKFYDKTGAMIGSATFSSNLANGASQMKLLIATTAFKTLYNIVPDLTMLPTVIAGGGRVCWDSPLGVLDCAAWGNDPGTAGTSSATDVGVPFNKDKTGLVLGEAMVRRLDGSGGATTLEVQDDTNNCADDFVAGMPTPKNNANQTGTPPASVCGDAVIQGLEQCDDGGVVPGDGCSATCRFEKPDLVFRDAFDA